MIDMSARRLVAGAAVWPDRISTVGIDMPG